MGWNSVLYVLNDHLTGIKEDKELGVKIDRAISECSCYHREADVRGGVYVAGVQHADVMQVYGIGGNCAIHLGNVGLLNDKEKILRALADDMGFDLHKKPARRKRVRMVL